MLETTSSNPPASNDAEDYDYRVRAWNYNGNGEWVFISGNGSNTEWQGDEMPLHRPLRDTVRSAPGVPVALSVSGQSSGQLSVRWNPPKSDGNSAITGYSVMYRSTEPPKASPSQGSVGPLSTGNNGNNDDDSMGGVVDTTKTGVTIEGLNDGTEYTVQVVARNDEGESPALGPGDRNAR